MVISVDVHALLAASKSADGGFGSVPGAPPEPAATALAAIALDDADAVAWLIDAQRTDGSFGIDAGGIRSDDTALVALSLPAGDPLERALDHVVATAGANAVDGPGAPPYGWAWTIGAHGWTEPTALGVLALRRLRPDARERIEDGLEALRDRACVGGGWNYGTRESFGIDEPPFVQTTAIALLAVAGLDDRLTADALDVLRRRWRDEDAGLLSLAVATAALRVLGDDDAVEASRVLTERLPGSDTAGTVAVAWGAIALGPGSRSFEAA